jgi:hypothetical protein
MPRQVFSKFSFDGELPPEKRDSIYEAANNRFSMGSVYCGWEDGKYTIMILGERLTYMDLQWLHMIAAWDGDDFIVNSVV